MKNNSTTDKNSLNRLAVKAGLFYVFAQLLVRGITFLVTPFLTRLLTNEQYNDIRVYESWLLIAVPTLSLCLWKSVDRAKYDMKERYNEYVSASQTLSFLAIGTVFAVSLFFKEEIKAICNCDMNDLMFYMAFFYIFAYTAILFFQRREKQLMRYKMSTLVTSLTVIPATLLSLLLIWFGKNAGYSEHLVSLRVIGFYVPHVIGGAIIAVLIWKQGKKSFSRSYWKYGLLYSLPLIPEAISIQIMNQADKIMVTNMIGKQASSFITLGTTVSFIIWILEDSVWNAWLPWLFEKMSRNEASDVEKPWTIIMHAFGILSWMLVLISPEIVLVLGGRNYSPTIYLIAPMLCGTLFRFYSYSYTAVENYHKKTGFVAAATVGTMLLNVILNYFCIRHFGYQAAAYTTAFSYFVLMLVQGWLEYRITGTIIIPMKKSVLICIAYFMLCCASMTLFSAPFAVRYAVLLCGCAAAAKLLLPKCMGILKTLRK